MEIRNTAVSFVLKFFFLAGLSLAVYLPSLPGEFVYDDYKAVLFNPCVSGAVPESEFLFRDFWCSAKPQESTGSFRPLSLLWLRSVYAISGGAHIWAYRIAAIFLLTLTSLVFWLLALRLGLGKWGSVLASILFVLNPAYSEAVLSPAGISDLLFALFAVLFFFHLIDRRKKYRYLLPLVWFVLALASKESALALLPAAILVDALIWFSSKSNYDTGILTHKWNAAIFYAASFAIAGMYLLWRLLVFGRIGVVVHQIDNPMITMHTSTRLLYALAALGKSFRLMLQMAPLSIDHTGCVYSSLNIAIGILVMVLGLFGIYWSFKKRSILLAIATALFFAGYAIASNFVIVSPTILAERQLILPTMALALVVAAALHHAYTLAEQVRIYQIMIVSLSVLLGVFMLYKAQMRMIDWRSERLVYASACEACPNSYKMWENYGHLLRQEGNGCAAIEPLEQALSLAPDGDKYFIRREIAAAHHLCGEFEIAIQLYEELSKENPQDKLIILLQRHAKLEEIPRLLLIKFPFR